ncbi:hypothetical protein COO60DRAFT_733869 [Scenedesmus sp. NREL 46B-D3]|nr:hypothetical protein COO60DRAFT_733869 [Scenedesmus sp. NREL 46B-D3]
MRPNEDLATAEAQGHVHQRVLERALDNSAAHSRLETTNQHSIEVAAGTGHLQNRDAAGGCGVAVATNAEDVVKEGAELEHILQQLPAQQPAAALMAKISAQATQKQQQLEVSRLQQHAAADSVEQQPVQQPQHTASPGRLPVAAVPGGMEAVSAAAAADPAESAGAHMPVSSQSSAGVVRSAAVAAQPSAQRPAKRKQPSSPQEAQPRAPCSSSGRGAGGAAAHLNRKR